ncbi:hypothetical protein HID58_093366 [Brassica napus]|uniref:Uncharacterized protein n=1 Tax=Brassica napus TaxID=3708 RepID=A0ABQ7XDR8_BRANA|nr:hypothetical protein HID58_093366 [Brassica napus]
MCGLDRWIADVIRSESSDLDVQNQILGRLFLDESLPSSSSESRVLRRRNRNRGPLFSSVSLSINESNGEEDGEGGEGYNGQHVYKPPSLKENRSGALNTTKHLWVCCHGFKGFGLSRTCIAPLQRMKLEYIVCGEQRSLLGLIQRIATTEGIRGFWKGNLVNILRTAPFKSINFYAYDTYRGQLLRLSGNEETTNFERFVAGAAAGVTASLLCLPLDTIRTVMVALGGEALGGVVDAFRHMIQTEGIGGWRTKWHVYVNLAMKVLRQCLFLSDVPVNVLGGINFFLLFLRFIFLSLLPRTVWWAVPTIWLPVVCYVLSISARKGLTFPRIGLIVVFGVLTWTLLEYTLSSLPFPHRNQELLASAVQQTYGQRLGGQVMCGQEWSSCKVCVRVKCGWGLCGWATSSGEESRIGVADLMFRSLLREAYCWSSY